ncbi:AAA family ATPase [Spiroplasma attinicola]|uniref:AAA family ATPase n=1 Tax=Spiroplasma attinicola TaxID=2904537 RepID=UPI002022AC7F|nr:AAA family ATPase [Spiroplasma sp. JKS002670]MCL8209666.1 hypothetical protein [Spiroplasma sp. JKS002670]
MKLSLKNIGPFHECTLNISDVTVIAGINDTGKSYLNKILFSALKTLSINIESDLLENFSNFSNSISTYLKNNIEEFETKIPKKLKDKNDLLSLVLSIKDLSNSLDSFNFLNANNFSLKEFLKSYLVFFNQNQEKINSNIKNLNFFLENNQKNKAKYYFYHLRNLKEVLQGTNNIFDNFVKQLTVILKKDEADIYSLLSNNIFEENFNEDIKNKNYLEENTSLILSLDGNDLIKITNKIIINKNLKVYNDVTYISDTFKLFEKIINQKTLSKKDEINNFYLKYFLLRNNNVSSIFSFTSNNFDSDLDTKISVKNAKALNEIFFKNEIKSKFESYFSLNNKLDKVNNIFVNKRGANIKFINASKGLKIIEAFQQLINTTVFSENNILILDEPEAFLHPEWQYLFIKWLLDVAATIKNFKLVISTHSPYIIDIIESFSTRQFKQLKFSYNFLTKDDKQDSIIINEKRPEKINSVLNGPFRKLENDEYDWDHKA